MRARWLAGLCVAALAGGCAATTYTDRSSEDRRVGGAFQQPFRDVGWTRENPPQVLIRAAEAPYALEAGAECSAILAETAELDTVLGPDLDAENQPEAQSDTDATGLFSGAIRGLIGLPYRGIIRRFSGAEGRERVLREAILAGMVRRAFLRGAARAAACASPTPDAQSAGGTPLEGAGPPPQ